MEYIEDDGASGYGENPITGLIHGRERSLETKKKREYKGTFAHPLKQEIFTEIIEWLRSNKANALKK